MRTHLLGIIGAILVVVGVLAGIAFAVVYGVAGTRQSPTYTPGSGMMRGYPRGRTTPAPSTPASPTTGVSGYATLGEHIFYTGIGHSGQPIPRTGGIGMMGAGGCVNCHGTDGRGRNIGGMMTEPIDVPDIRYSTLTSPKPDDSGKTQPGWTDAQIAAAIRDGTDPDTGGSLQTYMPRWQMDDQDMAAVIGYLKELK